jgi:Plasmid pRiA4b ORF-3-like protein
VFLGEDRQALQYPGRGQTPKARGSSAVPRSKAAESPKERGLSKKRIRTLRTVATLGRMAQVNQSVSIYQFRILLRRTSPHIWRRVLLRSNATVTELQHTIQEGFG